MATTDQWRTIEGWAEHLTGVGHDPTAACILDLRRRVEALEQRAAAPAPAADRPLWEVMYDARCDVLLQGEAIAHRYAAEIDAVADWLEDKGYLRGWELLRAEARRAREGQ